MKALILSWLLAQPVSKYDAAELPEDRTARLEVVADAVATVANGDRLKAAFVLVQAKHESSFRRDVQVCECPPKQCDGGRAHGLSQAWSMAVGGDENWWALCGVELEPTTRSFRVIANRFDPTRIEHSYARLGGVLVKLDAPWVLRRAAEARKLARSL